MLVGQVDGRDGAREPPPVSADNPFVQARARCLGPDRAALDAYRDVRDDMDERMFKTIYESPWLAAAVGIEPRPASGAAARSRDLGAGRARSASSGRSSSRTSRRGRCSTPGRGCSSTWCARTSAIDERPFNMRPAHDRRTAGRRTAVARERSRQTVKRQAFVAARSTRNARSRPCRSSRPRCTIGGKGFDAARLVMKARGELTPHQEERFRARRRTSSGLDQPCRRSIHEPRKVPAADRPRKGLAPTDRGRPPVRRISPRGAVDAARSG